MKKWAMVWLMSMTVLFGGCAALDTFVTGEKANGEKAPISLNTATGALQAASSAGVPFAGAGATVLSLLGGLYASLRGRRIEKNKNIANYKAIQDADRQIRSLIEALKIAKETKSWESVVSIADKLDGLIKQAAVLAQAGRGVKESVEKDIANLRKRGILK